MILKILSIQIIIAFLLLPGYSIAQQPAEEKQEKTIQKVGIMPFTGEGFSKEQLKTMSAKFQDELFMLNKFQLMEQEEMKSILKEAELAETGCLDITCYVEVGKKIGVSHMLMGSVVKVGSITSITIKIVDVETGKIIKSTVFDTKDSYEKILKKRLKIVADKIAGKAKIGKSIYEFSLDKKRDPIAVLEITGNGIGKGEAKGLTDRLRAELFNTSKFDVMEREQVDEILKEQGFQQTGLCDEASCLVEVGQLIGVKYMVGGSVSKIGNLFSVSARIIEVGTGKIVRTATVDRKGNLEKVLKENMQDIARCLAGLKVQTRVNKPAVITLSSSALLVGGGVCFSILADQAYERYKSEQYDLDKVSSYKDETRIKYYTSYGLYGSGGVAAGVSIIMFITRRVKLKVKDTVFIVPHSKGIQLCVRF